MTSGKNTKMLRALSMEGRDRDMIDTFIGIPAIQLIGRTRPGPLVAPDRMGPRGTENGLSASPTQNRAGSVLGALRDPCTTLPPVSATTSLAQRQVSAPPPLAGVSARTRNYLR